MVTKLQLTHELPEGFSPVESYPRRGPIDLAEALRPFVQGKVFCDLGCGAGDMAELLVPYAKKVIGVERERKRANKRKKRSFELVVCDFLKSIPDADLYYNWSGGTDALQLVEALHDKRKEKCIFLGAISNTPHFELLEKVAKYGMEIYEFEHQDQNPNQNLLPARDPDPELWNRPWWIALL